jgi:TfoX-like protein
VPDAAADGAAQRAFDALAERFLRAPGVEEHVAFSSPGLRVGGRIFAMLTRGELVVKLPAQRCAELVAAGEARPFEMGARRMREWVVVPPVRAEAWPAVAEEAYGFVRSLR